MGCSQFFSDFSRAGGRDPPLPLKTLSADTVVLETGEGPTLAFKDIGQQMVAQLLNHYLGARNKTATVLVETSGDTGAATRPSLLYKVSFLPTRVPVD